MNYDTLFTLWQEQKQAGFSLGVLEIFVGLTIGLSPQIYSYVKDKTRWSDEKKVVRSQADLNQSVAIENIASAAGQLLDQSQKLAEKNISLIASYETALEKQAVMFQEEQQLRKLKEQQHLREIEELKAQINIITNKMVQCSTDIVRMIIAIQNGEKIEEQRIAELQKNWSE